MADENETDWPEKIAGENETTLITHSPGENGDSEAAPPVQGFDKPGPFSTPSIVDMFKQEQEELASAKSVFIPVRGYEKTGLQIRYKMPGSGKELEMVVNKVNRQHRDAYSRNLYSAMDMMIHLCDGLFVQPEGVPEPVMLDPDEVGEPCGFDTTLAQMLGMDLNSDDTTARAVVTKLFGGNELAVMTHAFDLNRWLQNTKADLNLEIWQVGE
jgi:hypothetical protein